MKISIYLIEENSNSAKAITNIIDSNRLLSITGQSTSATEILTKLQTEFNDIYLINIDLEDGHGLNLMQEIHHQSPRSKILAISELNNNQRVIQSLRSGATGFITQADLTENLICAITCIVNGGAYFSAYTSKLLIDEIKSKTNDAPTSKSLSPDLVVDQERLLGGNLNMKITPKELEILRLLEQGVPAKVIAYKQEISVFTVNQHLRNIYRKFNVHNRMEAVIKAQRTGLLVNRVQYAADRYI